jgi:hypothetical protein
MSNNKKKDAAVFALEAICNSLGISFMYANLFEANYGLDALDDKTEFPCFIFFANDSIDNRTTETGLLLEDRPIVGMLVTVDDSATSDYTSKDADSKITEMYELYLKLLAAVNKSPMTYVLQPVERGKFNKVYAKFDRHVMGGMIEFTWVINTGKGLC